MQYLCRCAASIHCNLNFDWNIAFTLAYDEQAVKI